ncbi:hypothetical protein PFLUV_G00218250 [Perca fluviatilis]|uniref:Uncharacterized protein n=1 Tax=Perca fluviatilis TaxID=8168 RepID=A0A6A5EM37_PERFL|nr:hypothetical protein PFLUV_G00218250 [Perca fluviatilis]
MYTGDSQFVRLSNHRGRLYFSGFRSELQPLPSEKAGPELQSSRRVRREVSVCWTENSQFGPWWRAEVKTWFDEVFL